MIPGEICGSLVQQRIKLFLRQSTSPCARGNAVAETPKLLDIDAPESIEVRGRNDDGHLAFLPPDRHRLSLNSIQQSGESLLGL